MEITETIALKVRNTVRQGLSSGLGVAEPGKMCVEAAVCFALGLPHGDDPPCVARSVRSWKITHNDDPLWLSPMSRAKGLERLAIAQLGSAGAIDEAQFVKRVAAVDLFKATASKAYNEATAPARKAYDEALSECAEAVVQILIEMKAPGCQWLYLTEDPK